MRCDMAESGDDKELCKVDVIANLFGVSVRRVQQLTQEGIISTTEVKRGRRYELTPTPFRNTSNICRIKPMGRHSRRQRQN